MGYKIATSSEPSSYTYTAPTDADSLYSMMSIQNADTSIAPAITNTLTDGSTVSHSAPSIHPVGSNDLLLSTVTMDSSSPASIGFGASWTVAPGMTELVDQQVENFMTMIIGSETLTNTGDTGRKTHRPVSAGSANPGIAYSIAIKGTRDTAASVLPDSTLTGNTWTGTHVDIDETGVPDAAGLVAGTTDVARSGNFTFQDPVVTKPVDYVQLNVCAHSYTSAVGGVQDTLGIRLTVDGVAQTQETVTPPYSASGAPTSCTVYTFTYYGTWTQTQLANLQVNFTRNMLGTTGGNVKTMSDNIRVEYARLRVLSHDPFVETRPITTTPTVRDIKSANIASATSPKTVARPTVQQGDLLIAILGVDRGLLHEATLPTGFTEISWLDGFFDDVSTTTPLARAKVGIKVATSSEPTSYSYGVNASANSRIDIISVEGADTAVTPVVARRMTLKSGSVHRAASVYPPGRADLLLATIIKSPTPSGGVTWTPPSGMTENSDAFVASGLTMTTASQALTNGEPTSLKEFTQTTDSSYQAAAFTIAVKGITPPSHDQSTYRLYSTSGAPLAAQNTPGEVLIGSAFRLRQSLNQIASTTLTSNRFKVQAGEKVSTCSATTYGSIVPFLDLDAKTVHVQDTFATADTTKWTGYGSNITVDNNRAQFNLVNPKATLSTNNTYNLAGSELSAEIERGWIPSENASKPSFAMELADGTTPGNYLNITLFDTTLRFVEGISGSSFTTVDINYDPTNHRWWKIRVHDGVAYWLTSPDGVSWTTQRQKTLGIPSVTSMKVNLSGGYNASGQYPGVAYIDNVLIALPFDGGAVSTLGSDVVPASGALIRQETSDDELLGVKQAIPVGDNGLWEIALRAPVDAAGKTFCFRIVRSDGTLLTSYSQYAEVNFAAGTPALEQQLRGGQAVVNGRKTPFSW